VQKEEEEEEEDEKEQQQQQQQQQQGNSSTGSSRLGKPGCSSNSFAAAHHSMPGTSTVSTQKHIGPACLSSAPGSQVCAHFGPLLVRAADRRSSQRARGV
jgi:hypothetical protein